MSADNGIYVMDCYDRSDLIGLWYYSASVDTPPQDYLSTNAQEVYTDAIAAIIAAHRLNDITPTEYGVTVDDRILKGTEFLCEKFRWHPHG